jgi:RIO-like serine/threonine protein kinase
MMQVHLSSFGLVHRDLAARNVLLCEDNAKVIIKIFVRGSVTSHKNCTELSVQNFRLVYFMQDQKLQSQFQNS